MSPFPTPLLTTLLVGVIMLSIAAPVRAGQILVAPRSNWDQLASKVRPGDEIILMPGEHRPVTLTGIAGTGAQPVVIRGLSTEKISLIEADKIGLRLEGCTHVLIKDLTISGATINGLSLKAPADGSPTPWPADIRVQNVTILETGPSGRRNGIAINRLSGVRIERCTLIGWAGAGIDVVAAADIEIKNTTFRGREGFTQRAGISIRGSSENVRVSDCRLIDAGTFSLEIGAEATANDGLPAPPDPDRPLASRVRVSRCVIEGSSCPISFFGVSECSVRNVTIVRPGQWVMGIDLAPPDKAHRASDRVTFSSNLITWEPGGVKALCQSGPRFDPRGLIMEQNLWWSEGNGPSELPVTPVFPQITDVDPRLNEKFEPQALEAELFGARAP